MHHFHSSIGQRKAFTLVQFVLTLVIVVGLAALLFPILGRESNPHRPSCQSHLKQIGLGIKQYVQDYDERFPIWQAGSDPAKGWTVAIYPYLKSTQIYQCPDESTSHDPNPGSSGYSDYFYNSVVVYPKVLNRWRQ
jgi:hypothetical protein